MSWTKNIVRTRKVLGIAGFAFATAAWNCNQEGFAATPPTPTYGTAVVNGNPSEWALTNDFLAPMYTAGAPSKPALANGYLRYDCASQTLYVLVLQHDYLLADAAPLLTSPT